MNAGHTGNSGGGADRPCSGDADRQLAVFQIIVAAAFIVVVALVVIVALVATPRSAHPQPLYQDFALTPPVVYEAAKETGWSVTVHPRWSPDSTRVLWQSQPVGQFTADEKEWILSWLDSRVLHSSVVDSVLDSEGFNQSRLDSL